MRLTAPLACLLLLCACSHDAPPPTASTSSPAAEPAPAPTTPAPEPTPTPTLPSPVERMPAFVGAPWHAVEGSGVEVGTTYTFQPDGTLIVDAPNGTPATGAWRDVDGALTMTEEGVDYATDVVEQDATHLHLRSHNPGGTVELLLER